MAKLPPWLDAREDRFARLVLPNAPLEILGEGFAWLEGPVWCADANQLLVSDLPNDRILRWTNEGIGVFRQPAQFPNGHTRDLEGRLIGCHHGSRCVTRTDADGGVSVLADAFEGVRLNGPNDVVVADDGAIWFSDPLYGGGTDYEGGKHDCALPARVYRLGPDGTLAVALETLSGPNGLCFSPDGTKLYVADSGAQFGEDPTRAIWVFAVVNGALHDGRVFHRTEPGFTDGLRCDEDGRVWASAGDGVHVLDPDGTHLGSILTGGTVANLCFGGRSRARLFICGGSRLLSVFTNVRGAQRP